MKLTDLLIFPYLYRKMFRPTQGLVADAYVFDNYAVTEKVAKRLVSKINATDAHKELLFRELYHGGGFVCSSSVAEYLRVELSKLMRSFRRHPSVEVCEPRYWVNKYSCWYAIDQATLCNECGWIMSWNANSCEECDSRDVGTLSSLSPKEVNKRVEQQSTKQRRAA